MKAMVPARPDQARPKSTFGRSVLIVAAVFLGIGLLQGFIEKDGPAESSGGGVSVTESVDEASAMRGWWADNHVQWNEMADRLQALDLPGAVAIADSIDPMPTAEAQAIWDETLDDFHAALDAWNVGDVNESTRYVKQAGEGFDELTAYVEGLA